MLIVLSTISGGILIDIGADCFSDVNNQKNNSTYATNTTELPNTPDDKKCWKFIIGGVALFLPVMLYVAAICTLVCKPICNAISERVSPNRPSTSVDNASVTEERDDLSRI